MKHQQNPLTKTKFFYLTFLLLCSLALPYVAYSTTLQEQKVIGELVIDDDDVLVEEIIIERDGKLKGERVILEISDDDILVNGRPLEEFITLGLRLKRNMKERNGHTPKPFLGVVTKAREGKRGLLITKITPNSGASKAGLMKGDIILSTNGKPINTSKELSQAIKKCAVGARVSIQYERNNREKKVTATLGKWQGSRRGHDHEHREKHIKEVMKGAYGGTHRYLSKPKLGISVETLPKEKGIKISSVEEESLAEKAGLKKGDIIRKAGDFEIELLRDFSKAIMLYKLKEKPLKLHVERNGKTREIILPVPIKRAQF